MSDLRKLRAVLGQALQILDDMAEDKRPDPVIGAAGEAVTALLKDYAGMVLTTRRLAEMLAAKGVLGRSASTLQQRILPALAEEGYPHAKRTASGRVNWRHPLPVPPGFQRKDQ